MKKVFLLCLISSLTSCSILDNRNIAPGYKEAYTAINSALFGEKSKNNINRDLINSIPYASMLLKIGNGPEGLMILESFSRGKETWVSEDGVRLVIKNGRIISSSGLLNNLKDIALPKKAYNFNEYLYIENNTFYSYYSFSNPTLIDLRVEHVLNNLGFEDIDILEISKRLNLIEEYIQNREIRWSHSNKYWIDEGGYVWKSEQKLSPKLPIIYYQVTKKPSS
jgi:hypothetical protein